MRLLFELNQRHGRGYQVHLIMPPVDSVYDSEPMTLYEAGECAAVAIDEINKGMGTNYQLLEVVSITDEALQANSTSDLASMKILRDIKKHNFEHVYPAPTQPDFKKTIIDGEETYLMNGRGAALTCYFSWKDDKLPKARQFLESYCRLIASRGAKGGATALFRKLDAMSRADGTAWIKETYGQYIDDGSEVIALMKELGR